MKRNECNIVQDLIPLVIDRVACDDSRELVENHISVCSDCRDKYNAMKADLPDTTRSEYEKEQQKFVTALRAVRKTRLKRRIISISLAALICLITAFGGLFAYDRLIYNHTVPVDNTLYSLSLARLKDGNIVVTADSYGISFNTTSHTMEVLENGKTICYVYFTAAPIHWNSDTDVPNRQAKREISLLDRNEDQTILEIRQGTPNNYVTIWTEGDLIADASEQMEFYFALEKQWMEWWDNLPTTDDGARPIVDTREIYAWQDKVEEARLTVPEWQ